MRVPDELHDASEQETIFPVGRLFSMLEPQIVKKFYAFYVWPYGNQPRREEFATVKEVEAFYKQAMDSTSGSDAGESDYRNLVIIYGEPIRFEPAKVVEAWRICEEPE